MAKDVAVLLGTGSIGQAIIRRVGAGKKFFTLLIIFLLSIASSYDLREAGRVSSVKNQGIPGPCWAFAALGAMESNFLTQGLGKAVDLSEMQIAFYCYRDPETKRNFTSRIKSGTLRLEGNAFMTVAMMSRLSGPTDEKNLKYSTSLSDSEKKALSKKSPEKFKRSLRLRDAYFLSGNKTVSDSVKKSLIAEHGALLVSIYSDPEKYRTFNNHHYTYFNNSHGTQTNHDVLLAGWDDDFSRENFSPKPENNGAWLVKNSWGTSRGTEGGYFWIPYEQYTTGGTAFIVERNNNRLRHYGYDDLGFCKSLNYSWCANVFKLSGKKESLKEISFYTVANNTNYEAYIYFHGKNFPKSPVSGELISTLKGVQNFAGYHTVNLPESFTLNEGEYFSVVLKLSGGLVPVEAKCKNYSENAEVNPNESYFSLDGRNWTDGFGIGCNACVKAFTVSRI